MLIELTRGKRAIIDMVDVDLAGRSWHAVPGHSSVRNYTFYAARRKGTKRITLHREILERILGRKLREGEECDRRQRLEQQKMQSETAKAIASIDVYITATAGCRKAFCPTYAIKY